MSILIFFFVSFNLYFTFVSNYMKMKRALRTILFGFIFGGTVNLFAQDPELTQFYAAPVYTNPALAGSAVCQSGAAGRLAINYRNQWPNLPGTFRSYCVSWDQHSLLRFYVFGGVIRHFAHAHPCSILWIAARP